MDYLSTKLGESLWKIFLLCFVLITYVLYSFASENQYLYLPPNRYVFHGAEVYDDDEDDDKDDSSSSSSSSSPSTSSLSLCSTADGSSVAENGKPLLDRLQRCTKEQDAPKLPQAEITDFEPSYVLSENSAEVHHHQHTPDSLLGLQPPT